MKLLKKLSRTSRIVVAKLNCNHDIIWEDSKNFYGVFPQKEHGVCKICGQQFVRVKEKGGTNDVENKIDDGRNERVD